MQQTSSFLYMVFEILFKVCEIDANGWTKISPETKELLKKALQVDFLFFFNKIIFIFL